MQPRCGWRAAGLSDAEIIADYPELTKEDIRACLPSQVPLIAHEGVESARYDFQIGVASGPAIRYRSNECGTAGGKENPRQSFSAPRMSDNH